MRSVLAATLAAVLAAASPALAGAVDDALAAFEAGKWEEARTAAEAVKKSDPDYARAQYVVGECRLQEREWQAAADAFRAALAKKPKSVPILTGLGRSLTAAGDLEGAKQPLEKAVKLDGKDTASLRALGDWMAASDDLKSARRTLGSAWKLDPKDPLTARSLVDVQLRMDDDKAAGSTARKLISALPKHPMGHFLAGWVFDSRNDDKKAIAAYEKALELDDTFIDAHKNLAIICTTQNPTYQDRERTELAMKHYGRYFALGGDDPELENIYRQLCAVLGPAGFDIGEGLDRDDDSGK